MKSKSILYLTTIVTVLLLFFSCKENQNNDATIEILDEHALNRKVDQKENPSKIHEVYVPIYSDIYNQTRDSRTLLTATLSIRNTSSKDSLFINKIGTGTQRKYFVNHSLSFYDRFEDQDNCRSVQNYQ